MKTKLLLILLLSSCTRQVEVNFKEVDFGAFSISIPKDWNKIVVQGYDSQVNLVVTSDGDTLSYDYGYYSNNLDESRPKVYPISTIDIMLRNGIDTTGRIFLDKNKIEDKDLVPYLKQRTKFEMIDGYKAKIVSPRMTEKGITGVYFDSITTGPMGIVKLQFSGSDLNTKNDSLFQIAIRTIRFK